MSRYYTTDGDPIDAEDVLDAEELAGYYDRVRPGWRRRELEPLPVRTAGEAS